MPILTTLKATKSPFIAFLLICAAWIFVAGYTSINAVVKAELFPTNVRALGVGLPYAITVSLFGGTAPAIALYFKSLGHEDWFYYYLSGIIFLSLIIYPTMRDTKHAIGDASPRITQGVEMTDENEPPPDSKLTRSKQRWAREGRFLTGKTSRARTAALAAGTASDPGLAGPRSRRDAADLAASAGGSMSMARSNNPIFWDLPQFTAQPQTKFTSDIHCVTTWSRYDNQWEGTGDARSAGGLPAARGGAVSSCCTPMTATPPISRWRILPREDALLAHSWSGAPLEQEHGGPVRLVVPHLYFWKSAKWLQSIEFLAEDAPGYWEVRGYHNRGDPWARAALFRRLTLHADVC